MSEESKRILFSKIFNPLEYPDIASVEVPNWLIDRITKLEAVVKAARIWRDEFSNLPFTRSKNREWVSLPAKLWTEQLVFGWATNLDEALAALDREG